MRDTIRGLAVKLREKAAGTVLTDFGPAGCTLVTDYGQGLLDSAKLIDALADVLSTQLNGEEFDATAYSYRSTPVSMPHKVVEAFERLKLHIRAAYIGEKEKP